MTEEHIPFGNDPAPQRPATPPPAPHEIETAQEQRLTAALVERREAALSGPVTLDSLTVIDSSRVIALVESRAKALESMRRAGIKLTHPQDWVLFKGRDGRVTASLKRSGAQKVAKLWGISFHPRSAVEVSTSKQKVMKWVNGEKTSVVDDVTTAEIYGDAVCSVTGETVEGLRAYRRTDEEFVGRGTIDDLKQAAHTAGLTKAVRILAAFSSVPIDELADAWGKAPKYVEENAVLGAGYSKQQREQAVQASTQNAPAHQAEGGPRLISEPQAKRLWAIASKRGETIGMEGKAILVAVCKPHGIESSKLVPVVLYEQIVAAVEAYEPPGASQ